MSERTTYLFAGGGTGGHLFPGLAVAGELLARDANSRCLFIGSERAIEKQIIDRAGFEHLALPIESSTSLKRHPLRFASHYWQSSRMAGRIIAEQTPTTVFGLGGFASVPVVKAASRRRIPIVLLEQNVIAGRATQWLCKQARAICLSFPQEHSGLPAGAPMVFTGNPVGPAIARLYQRETSAEADDAKTLLVLGGSQGARGVNDAVLGMLGQMKSAWGDWTILHQTGLVDFERVSQSYRELETGGLNITSKVAPFFDELDQHYKTATLAISRAGATSLAELACAGCPTVLIPYPQSLKDHQLLNARYFAEAGGALVVEQSTIETETASRLADAIRPLLNDAKLREQMQTAIRQLARPDAAVQVADVMAGLTAQ